jgi:hypothetical protein
LFNFCSTLFRPDPDHPPNHANPEHEDYDPDYETEYPDYPTLVAAKWNPIFERVKVGDSSSIIYLHLD